MNGIKNKIGVILWSKISVIVPSDIHVQMCFLVSALHVEFVFCRTESFFYWLWFLSIWKFSQVVSGSAKEWYARQTWQLECGRYWHCSGYISTGYHYHFKLFQTGSSCLLCCYSSLYSGEKTAGIRKKQETAIFLFICAEYISFHTAHCGVDGAYAVKSRHKILGRWKGNC